MAAAGAQGSGMEVRSVAGGTASIFAVDLLHMMFEQLAACRSEVYCHFQC